MSLTSNIFYLLLKALKYGETNDRRFLAEIETGIHSDSRAKPSPTPKILRSCRVTTATAGGHPFYTISPLRRAGSRVILYFHGGAYLRTAVAQHWNFVHELTAGLGYEVVFPDYPVAPEFGYQDVYAMAEAVYRDILKKHEPGSVILMGDSAGGGLALGLAMKLRDEGFAQPGHIVMISPWLDLGMENPDIAEVSGKDPFIRVRGLKAAGRSYARELAIDDPLVSPLYGRLHGLGQLTLFTGTFDILNPDARKFRELCNTQGIRLNWHEYPKMIHDWMILGFPESKRAIGQMDGIIRMQ